MDGVPAIVVAAAAVGGGGAVAVAVFGDDDGAEDDEKNKFDFYHQFVADAVVDSDSFDRQLLCK